MSFRRFVVAALLAAAPLAAATGKGFQGPPEDPVSGTPTRYGCMSSKGELTKVELEIEKDNNTFNSKGKCNTACRALSKNVAATQADLCFCGDKYPPESSMVEDKKCNEPCPGYGDEACGGYETFSVFNTGVRVSVGESEDASSSSSKTTAAPTTSAASTATNAPAETSTAPAEQATESAAPTGSTNTVGIAVGVVVGVLALAGVGGGVFFLMRRRRNNEIEEEHRRNAAVNAFITGGKPPSSSGGLSMSDSRLDPVMANRRMSDGSIADNEDYSRRILRVTNA